MLLKDVEVGSKLEFVVDIEIYKLDFQYRLIRKNDDEITLACLGPKDIKNYSESYNHNYNPVTYCSNGNNFFEILNKEVIVVD